MFDRKIFSERLILLRKRNKLSQEELGAKVKKSKQNINNWEKCVSLPALDLVSSLADYLDCSVDYLLGRTDEQNVHLHPHADENSAERADVVPEGLKQLIFDYNSCDDSGKKNIQNAAAREARRSQFRLAARSDGALYKEMTKDELEKLAKTEPEDELL